MDIEKLKKQLEMLKNKNNDYLEKMKQYVKLEVILYPETKKEDKKNV